MFTKKITDSDAFTELPPTTQALYFHLCMGADDDGFSNQIRKSMFNAHADRNDFELLVSKKFIIPFDNGVIVIKHWRMHNLIKNDRYKQTSYIEEKSTLILKDNGVYAIGANLEPNWNQVGTQVEPQDRIGKDRLDKDKENNAQSEIAHESAKERFEYLWSIYPNKKGKKRAFEAFQRALKKGVTIDQIRDGIKAYARYIKASGIDMRYVKQGSTFFAQESWNDDWTPEKPKNAFNQFEHNEYDFDELEKELGIT